MMKARIAITLTAILIFSPRTPVLSDNFCLDGSSNSRCHPVYASCEQVGNNTKCECKSGFTGDGTTCNDVDECDHSKHKCLKDATCTNLPGSFYCTCRDGLTGNGQDSCDPAKFFTGIIEMNIPFLEEYRNTSSPEFKALAKIYEQDAYNYMQQQLGTGIQKVQVLGFYPETEAEVLYTVKRSADITTQSLETVSAGALKLTVPDTATNVKSIRESSMCSFVKCVENSYCVDKVIGFECRCVDNFHKNDLGLCVKDDTDADLPLLSNFLIAGACLIALVLIIFVAKLIRKKRRHKETLNSNMC